MEEEKLQAEKTPSMDSAQSQRETLELVLPPQDVTELPKKKFRKRKSCTRRCLVACLIYLIFTAIVIGGLIFGANFAFNTYVSSKIGGVTFVETLRLMRGLYRGEKDRDKVLTDTATEEDLNNFYDELYGHLFLDIKSEGELTDRYNNELTAEEKAEIVSELQQDKDWNKRYEASEDKEGVAREYYVKTHRYPITIAQLMSNTELLSQAGIAAAEDGEPLDEATEEAPVEGEENEDTFDIASLLEGISFDFDSEDSALSRFDYTRDADYPDNVAAMTMRITGKEITAVLSEVMQAVLGSPMISEMIGGIAGEDANVDLSQYIRVPQVLIRSDYDPTGLSAAAKEATFNKNVCLAATVEIRIGAFLASGFVQKTLSSVVGDAVSPSLVKVILNVVQGVMPKTLFVTAGFYPYDEDRDMLVKINNYSEEDQENLIKIINATMGGNFQLSGQEQEEQQQATQEEQVSIFTSVNREVVKIFGSLEENGIPISFYEAEGENGRTVGLTLAHIQLLLHFAGLDGEDGITPHDFMTLLKCLFSQADLGDEITSDLGDLYDELETKYGISRSFWGEDGIFAKFGEDDIDLIGNINIKGIDFAQPNQNMRVKVHANEMVSMIKDAISTLTSGDTAAAEEGGEDGDFLSKIKDSLQFTLFAIQQEDDSKLEAGYDLYSFTFKINIGVQTLLGSLLEGDGESGIMNTLKSAFPKNLSMGMTLYAKVKDGVVVEYSPKSEARGYNYKISYLVNEFDAYYTSKALDILSKLISKAGGDGSLDLDEIGDKINRYMADVFNTVNNKLHCNLKLFEDEKGGGIMLPSLYEIIHGFGEVQLLGSETLTEADLPTVSEIQGVLHSIFDYKAPKPTVYDETKANALLGELQSKYYLKNALTATDLFGEESDLSNKFSGDFFDTKAMYRDTRTLDELSVALDADALADLIEASGKIKDIAVADLIDNVKIVGSNYSREGKNLYLNFTFEATFGKQVESRDDSLSMTQLMPDILYLTAKVLLHNDDEDYTEATPRFYTVVGINQDNKNDPTANLLRLVKVFTGSEIDTASVGEIVQESVQKAFDIVEANLPLSYTKQGDAKQQMLINNIFSYLSEGKLVTDVSGTHYDRNLYMTDDDLGTRTTPLALMNRLRELGKADTSVAGADTFAANMVVWQDGQPQESGAKYNDNTFAKQDEDDFYTQLQDNYFFVNKPTMDSFTKDAANIFGNLSADNLDETFRLTGETGLYHYSGEQIKAKLSDKAMGSMIQSQGAVSVSSDYIESVEVTSFTLRVTDDKLQVEITTKIVTKGNELLPDVLYMTAVSESDKNVATKDFVTKITINRMQSEDLDKFFKNTSFLGTINLNDTIDTASVKNSISSALNELFNEKLKDYVESYGNYAENSTQGKGYLEFYSVYHKIVDTLGINRAKYANADQDIQQVIVSINTDHSNSILATSNPSKGDEDFFYKKVTVSMIEYDVPCGMSDRYFANQIYDKLDSDGKGVESVQSIFFVGNYTGSDSSVYQDWQTMLSRIDEGNNNRVVFADGKTYIVTTAKFTKGDLALNGMALLNDVESIYTTLVIDGATGDVVYTFFNDLTLTQTDMLFDQFTGTTSRTQINDTVKTVMDEYSAYVNYSQNEDKTFADYVGYMHD